ncbi:MAG: hypothetical protein WDW36_006706 [Sanguina aurantia]
MSYTGEGLLPLTASLLRTSSTAGASLTRQSSTLRPSSSLISHGSVTKDSEATTLQADVYLSELLSYSLERLRKEPELLRAEKEQVERNAQNIAVTQYGAFIETASCLGSVDRELRSVCDNLAAMLQTTPALASACENFSEDAATVLTLHNHNKQLGTTQSVLLELLEVPQLMDMCVRNAVYDEALDLQSFVTRLGLLHPNVPVVRALLQQVAEVGSTMLTQLLSRLRHNVALPECLRIMGYLRRIAAFTEPELRLQFLACRDGWIQSLVDELDSGGGSSSPPYEYVKHLTDVHRVHLFDAVQQYRAIFFDGPAGLAMDTSTLSSTSSAASSHVTAASLKETSILFSWVQHRLTLYLAALSQQLPLITDGGNLASVLEHSMYCGSSLSRVGLDFQGLLQPLFESCSLRLFASHLAAAVDSFNSRLEAHKWVPLPAAAIAAGRGGAGAAGRQAEARRSVAAGSTGDGAADASGDGAHLASLLGANSSAVAVSPVTADEPPDVSPPYSVMEHLPLAVFTNAVLVAFNELRHCLLLGLAKPMASLLQQALEQVAASLDHYSHTHTHSTASELQLFKSATNTMLEVVLPYLATCYSRLFPVSYAPKLDTSVAVSLLRTLIRQM